MITKKFSSDIDIDFGSRDDILAHISHTNASIRNQDSVKRHATGIYVTDIPYDPIHDLAAIDYTEAETRGYIKLDLLNVWVYQHVVNEKHLQELMQEPNWLLLENRDFFEKLIHIGGHYEIMKQMPEPIDSVTRMSMFLAIIRPAKRHLIGKTWQEVAKTIWNKPKDDAYFFKKAHAVGYGHLVVVNMNLLARNEIKVNPFV